MSSKKVHTKKRRLEKGLRPAEPLVANGDDLSIWTGIAFIQGGGRVSVVGLRGDITKLFLDVLYDFPPGWASEGVAGLGQAAVQGLGELLASHVQVLDGGVQGVSLVDGHRVGHTVTGLDGDTVGEASGEQGQHGLHGNVHGWGAEALEHELEEDGGQLASARSVVCVPSSP